MSFVCHRSLNGLTLSRTQSSHTCLERLVIRPTLSGWLSAITIAKVGNCHILSEYFLNQMWVKWYFQEEIETNHDLIATYRHHITTTMNQSNVSQFLRSFNNRGTLEVERPVPGGNINVRTLKLVQPMAFNRVHQKGIENK